MASLGEKLRGVRESKQGLSLNKLATQARIDKHSLSLYERDKQEPPFGRIKRLCEILQVRAGYLFDEIDDYRRLRPDQVAARESHRLFLQRFRLTEGEKDELHKLSLTPHAFTTVEGWADYLARTRAGRR
jgi:transcriptional regulator with XRE-family HTH domain